MADQREAPECGGSERPSSYSPISVSFFLERGGSRCPDRAGFWRAAGKSGQRLAPRRKSQCGEWERTDSGARPFRDPCGRLSGWSLSAWHVVFASRPASIRTDSGRLARCKMGSLVFGGALLSPRRSHWTKTPNAVSPIATVVLHFGARQLPPFSTLRFILNTRFVPNELNCSDRAGWFSALSYATFLPLRSASYASPVTHNRCKSTDSFRATAITARFLAFLPPRSQIRSPNRRKSLSLPCGPNM